MSLFPLTLLSTFLGVCDNPLHLSPMAGVTCHTGLVTPVSSKSAHPGIGIREYWDKRLLG